MLQSLPVLAKTRDPLLKTAHSSDPIRAPFAGLLDGKIGYVPIAAYVKADGHNYNIRAPV
jgi:hypothetical protein